MQVAIVVFEGADALDVVGPLRVFGAINDVRGAVDAPETFVHLVARELGPLNLSHGLRIEPTSTFEDCPEPDVVVVPGGSSHRNDIGRRAAQRDAATVAFITRCSTVARLTASVCTGAFLLAEAGLLAGRTANTHRRSRDELVAMMAARAEPFTLATQRVVWDGDVVTAGGVTSGIDLSFEIVEHLCGARVRRAAERALEIETLP